MLANLAQASQIVLVVMGFFALMLSFFVASGQKETARNATLMQLASLALGLCAVVLRHFGL